jgi:hypothetical protein
LDDGFAGEPPASTNRQISRSETLLTMMVGLKLKSKCFQCLAEINRRTPQAELQKRTAGGFVCQSVRYGSRSRLYMTVL